MKILVAEDDPNDMFLLERAFMKVGWRAPMHFCRDGKEVIDYLLQADPHGNRRANPWPNLLLLDLKMPRVDGFEVLEWLHKEGRLCDLRVVVLSSSEDSGDVKRAYELGAHSFHVKPFDAEQLTTLVDRLVKYWSDKSIPSVIDN